MNKVFWTYILIGGFYVAYHAFILGRNASTSFFIGLFWPLDLFRELVRGAKDWWRE